MFSSLSRRGFLGSAAIVTIGAMTGCASNVQQPGASKPSASTVDKSDENPFGFDTKAAGTIVIPLGGYGDGYLKRTIEAFKKHYPDAQITYEMVEDPKVKMQPRIASGDLPDLWNIQHMSGSQLAKQGKLQDLQPVLDAPSFDGGKVSDHLLAGWEKAASPASNGKNQAFPSSSFMRGFWYSQKVFDEHGWKAPATWAEFLEICEAAKAAGIAPIVYGGTVDYAKWPTLEMAVRLGGKEYLERLESLDVDAWEAEPMQKAAELFADLRKKDYFLKGSEGLNHTESQTYWAQGQAVFIPVGGWLENESADVIPSDYEPQILPTPSPDGAKLPTETIFGTIGAKWTVPTAAANAPFGMEFIRFLGSKEASRIWVEETKSPYVTDPTWVEDLPQTPGMKSQLVQMGKAKDSFIDIVIAQGSGTFSAGIQDYVTQLWAGKLAPKDFCANVKKLMQAALDDGTAIKPQR